MLCCAVLIELRLPESGCVSQCTLSAVVAADFSLAIACLFREGVAADSVSSYRCCVASQLALPRLYLSTLMSVQPFAVVAVSALLVAVECANYCLLDRSLVVEIEVPPRLRELDTLALLIYT